MVTMYVGRKHPRMPLWVCSCTEAKEGALVSPKPRKIFQGKAKQDMTSNVSVGLRRSFSMGAVWG